MIQFLANKHILLGVTGSIAAYKSPDLVRRLREAGASVRVVMTENAKKFITPLTLQAVSGFPVHDELFDLQAEAAMGHIELARWADLVIVAPATADFMARLVSGNANDLLTTICSATSAPIAIAPAMNQGMWKHQFTQANLEVLINQKITILGPGEGSQACGDKGPGRMLEPALILEKLNTIFATGDLAGIKILVTAGPTHEAIDPIRFMTNGSSGKMGYALAQAAFEAGAKVTIVSGPVKLKTSKQIEVLNVITAEEMYEAVMRKISEYDIFLAVAAVSDYRCQMQASQKIHKKEDEMQITLKRNPDIVKSVGELKQKPFIVGFAAETEKVIEQALVKRKRKKMDMVIANVVSLDSPMGGDENEVTVIGEGKQLSLPKMPKDKLARKLISIIAETFKQRKS